MVSKFTDFGNRTGHVDIIDVDLAVLRQTGAILDSNQNEWYLPLSFTIEDPSRGPVVIEKALVVYKRPEPTQVQHEVPQIAIVRDDIDFDASRLYSPTVQYRVPASGATPLSISNEIGFSSYETRDKDQPYNLTYTIEVWSRYEVPALILAQKMMKAFPPRGTLVVNATEEADRNIKNDRTYLFFQEGFANLGELNSMVERIPGYALTIRVEGELSADREPFTVPAFTGTRSETPIPGTDEFPEGNSDLPAGGLYGDGLPTVRSTLLED